MLCGGAIIRGSGFFKEAKGLPRMRGGRGLQDRSLSFAGSNPVSATGKLGIECFVEVYR
jgi:hypothetical protein